MILSMVSPIMCRRYYKVTLDYKINEHEKGEDGINQGELRDFSGVNDLVLPAAKLFPK